MPKPSNPRSLQKKPVVSHSADMSLAAFQRYCPLRDSITPRLKAMLSIERGNLSMQIVPLVTEYTVCVSWIGIEFSV